MTTKISRGNKFSDVFEHAAIGMSLASMQGQFLRNNSEFTRMLGYSSEELSLKNFDDLTFVEDIPASQAALRSLAAGEIKFHETEKRYIHKDGHAVWVHLNVSLIRDDSDQPLHFIKLIQDITERKESAMALQEKNEIFRILPEDVPQMVWITLPNGHNIFMNRIWTEYTGLSAAEDLGDAWIKPLHADDQTLARRKWAEAIKNIEEYSLEARIRKFDGTYRWWLIRGLPMRDTEGKVIKWIGTCTDIDGIMLALETARDDKRKMAEQASLLDQTRDVVLQTDLQGKILFWNQGAQKLYGWTAIQALGSNCRELLKEEPTRFKKIIKELLQQGYWEGEQLHTHRAGKSIEVESHWTLNRDERGEAKSILIISNDIGEKKKLQTQFLQTQRIESMNLLAGGIANDLNNVLSPILMTVDILNLDETDKGRLASFKKIRSNCVRGANIIKQVLSFSRTVEGDRVEIQPKNIIAEIEQIAKKTFPKMIHVRTRIDEFLPDIMGDSSQLQEVFLNLCENACDAMPAGGTLTLSLGTAELNRDDSLLPQGGTPGGYVVFGVEDTGTGIPEEALGKIFDPFFTTKGVGLGSGLGLANSRSLVESHGGFIDVFTRWGEGSKFKIYLPVAGLENENSAVALEPTVRMGRGECVLVVDDESGIREIIRQILEAQGYEILEARNGQEALEIYEARKDEIALILLDMMMPILSGLMTMRQLRTINPEVVVIASSGSSTSAGIEKAKYFLSKPFSAAYLLDTVERALSDRAIAG